MPLKGKIHSISVVGLGKLGAPLAACFAHKGYRVIGVDTNPQTVRLVNEGRAPVFEPGLEEMIQANRKHFIATEDYEKAIFDSQATFIVVPTPSDEQGGFSLQQVRPTCERMGEVLRKKSDYHLVVLTSTVLPGATEGEVKPLLEARSGKQAGKDFGLCYSPEFVALGSVISDFLHPDFILIGELDPTSGEILEGLYKNVCENDPPVARMNIVNAEVTKLAVNTFVTTKITFANLLARICERLPGADVDIVTQALGLDSRIGRKYLKGAVGYGGPCFPRDNVALSFFAKRLGTPATLAEATDKTNRSQVDYLASLLKSKLPLGGVVGILGLAYKPKTDVVEESQGLLLAQLLLRENIPLVVYDPAGMENARKTLDQSIRFATSVEECIRESTTLVITTPWEEFRQISPEILVSGEKRRVLIDCWRLLDPAKYQKVVDLIPLGIGSENSFAKP